MEWHLMEQDFMQCSLLSKGWTLQMRLGLVVPGLFSVSRLSGGVRLKAKLFYSPDIYAVSSPKYLVSSAL